MLLQFLFILHLSPGSVRFQCYFLSSPSLLPSLPAFPLPPAGHHSLSPYFTAYLLRVSAPRSSSMALLPLWGTILQMGAQGRDPRTSLELLCSSLLGTLWSTAFLFCSLPQSCQQAEGVTAFHLHTSYRRGHTACLYMRTTAIFTSKLWPKISSV